jgi:hypothetical protein
LDLDHLKIDHISDDILELRKRLGENAKKNWFDKMEFKEHGKGDWAEEAIANMLAKDEFERRWPNLTEEEITEGEKRAIIDSIVREQKKERIEAEARKTAGINRKHYDKPNLNDIETLDRIRALAGINTKDSSKKPSIEPQREVPKMSVFDKVNEVIDKGRAQDKILKSIKSNPKSKIFSKDFKWNLDEFLSAFEFLESKSYEGPFIVSIVKDKEELKKYAEINGMKEKVEGIYIGKYVLLSVYDIAAFEEDKYIYIGLKYSPMNGTLKFDTVGAIKRGVTEEQKVSTREFLDFHKIDYDDIL